MKRFFIPLLSLYFLACQSQSFTSSGTGFDYSFEAAMYHDPSIFLVDKFVDGDTFWVLNKDQRRIKIRLIGIDAPEDRNAFNKRKHPFGAHSKVYLDSVLTRNPYLKLTFDIDSLDRYGRTLAYAFLNDGTFLNELLVKEGYATLMTIPPNVKYENRLLRAQQYARKHKLGIWDDRWQQND